MDDEDYKLVRRCLDGDADSFGDIVDKYQKPVFRLAMRMVKNYDDAEDITQIVFIKIYDKLESFNPKYKFFSWLYRIAINETINYCKKKNKLDYIEENEKSGDKNPEEIYSELEIGEKVQSAIMQIDMFYRIPLVLKHFMNYSYKELGEILEIPEKTVKSRLFTARQLLKDILIENGMN